MGGLQWWHIVIVIIAFTLLFGYKRLPDAARGVGRSLRILKAEVGEMSNDKDKNRKPADVAAEPQAERAVVITPTPLAPVATEPIQPSAPVTPAPTQITIDGRSADSAR